MSADDELLQQEIFALISNKQGIKLKEISLEKSLNFDLGVDGDDAVELFEAYSEKFHVDLTPLGPEWSRYFGPEGIDLFGLIRLVTRLFAGPPSSTRPLPVSRLVDSARAGKWIPLSD